jgi:phage-related protein
MVGKIINVPLCAAEQFIGGLIATITEQIQEAIGPAMGAIGQILGPIGTFMDYMQKAINFAQSWIEFFKM